MDGTPFASLAQIRILLVPVGTIRKSVFERYSGLVKTIEHLRLGDIPPDSREDRSAFLHDCTAAPSLATDVVPPDRFVPSPLSSGSIHIRYTSHPPSAWHHTLSLLRLSSFPLAVIGIADCSQKDSSHSLAAEFTATLATIFSGGSATPFASKCFAFEDGDAVPDVDVGSSMPDLVMIPSLMSNKQVYIGTLLAELCHDILAEFPSIVSFTISPFVGVTNSLHSGSSNRQSRELGCVVPKPPSFAVQVQGWKRVLHPWLLQTVQRRKSPFCPFFCPSLWLRRAEREVVEVKYARTRRE